MTELEHAIKHIKTRADAWAVREVTEALQSISERLDKALSQEPCEDAVSRQAVLQAVSEGCFELRGIYGRCEELINELPSVTVQQCSLYSISNDGRGLCALLEENPDDTLLAKERQIEALPSVTQKSGKWERHYIRPNVYKDLLWYCSSCGKGCGYNNAFMFDFCPNCGAKMESEE